RGPLGAGGVVGGVVPGEVGRAHELHLAGGRLVHGVEHDAGHLGRQAVLAAGVGGQDQPALGGWEVVDGRVVPHEEGAAVGGGGRRGLGHGDLGRHHVAAGPHHLDGGVEVGPQRAAVGRVAGAPVVGGHHL